MGLRKWQFSFCPRLQLAWNCRCNSAQLQPSAPFSLVIRFCRLWQTKRLFHAAFLLRLAARQQLTYEVGRGLCGKGWLRAEVKETETPGVSVLKVELIARGWAPGQERHPARGPARRGLGIQAAPPPATSTSWGWAVTAGTGTSQRRSREGFA